MSEIKLPSYIIPYFNRRKFCRKVRDTEKEKRKSKLEGRWADVSRLGYVLRNAWWGYKRYKYRV